MFIAGVAVAVVVTSVAAGPVFCTSMGTLCTGAEGVFITGVACGVAVTGVAAGPMFCTSMVTGAEGVFITGVAVTGVTAGPVFCIAIAMHTLCTGAACGFIAGVAAGAGV